MSNIGLLLARLEGEKFRAIGCGCIGISCPLSTKDTFSVVALLSGTHTHCQEYRYISTESEEDDQECGKYVFSKYTYIAKVKLKSMGLACK